MTQTQTQAQGSPVLYRSGGFYCEMLGDADVPLPHCAAVWERIRSMDLPALRRRARAAERELFNLGITFTVYSDRKAICGIDRRGC
jgi:uncharacterized circularly permuted ATP-grasp superfamily protein